MLADLIIPCIVFWIFIAALVVVGAVMSNARLPK
jgi:hypothetical protein